MLNHVVAREYSGLVVNACTPGSGGAGLTSPMVDAGKTVAEFVPAPGTVSCMHLLFAELEGPSGRYYGSDAIRSPLDRYREPGDPPFVGP
jgi:hypothetical protein